MRNRRMAVTITLGTLFAPLWLGSAYAESPLVDDVTVALVALAAPSTADTLPSLPVSQADFPPGSTFFLEVWAQTQATNGLSQVSTDITFDPAVFTVTPTLTHSALFSLFVSGMVDNAAGLINNLSGSVVPVIPACNGQVGLAPEWARVATIEVTVQGSGTRAFVAASANDVVFINGNCGSLNAPPVTFLSATVTVASQPPVPTVTGWGLVVLCVLMLVAGTRVLQCGLSTRCGQKNVVNLRSRGRQP